MDFSELADFVKTNNEKGTARIIDCMMPILQRYLMIHYNASREDAKDSAQEAVIIGVENIRSDNIRNPDKILSFIMTTCRNNYFNRLEKRGEVPYDHLPSPISKGPDQLHRLYEEDKKKVLKYCLRKLSNTMEKFMAFCLNHSHYDAEQIASHFNISKNSVWTRKHRALKQLNECVKKNLPF